MILSMKRRSQLLAFLLLNVIVSAVTTWLVVTYMGRQGAIPGAQGGGLTLPEASDGAGEGGLPVNETAGQLEIDTVIGTGDLESERVLIRHIGDEEVSLEGWALEDEQENQFVFPALTIFSGGAVTVYTRGGINNVVELFWGLDTSIWTEGETVSLLDPNGDVQARFQIP